MAVLEVEEESSIFTIDDAYEFSAPRFFDFIKEESENDKGSAEIWFDSSLSYPPSPFIPKITTCEEAKEVACTQETGSTEVEPPYKTSVTEEECTPKFTHLLQTYPKNHQPDKKITSTVRKPSSLKYQNQPQLPYAKSTKPTTVTRETNLKNTVATPNFALENQPIKRQKLEEGRSRQILCIKTQNLHHKTRHGGNGGSSNSNLCSSTAKTHKEDRKVYVREPPAPFVSMAEMIQKFQTNTRDMSLPCMSSSLTHIGAASVTRRKPKLTLTRPREPEFETSQRARSVRIKSSTTLDEETTDKIPKFKARPLNKKILEAPTLLVPPRSTPQPEFQEIHSEKMERANQNAETSSVAPTESAPRGHLSKPHLTAPKSPILQTYLRAGRPRIKSSEEMEREELDKFPKFKAKPLNRKILESKGDVGIFWHTKREVTVPKEFRFATDDRIPPPVTVSDLFAKLTMNSEPHQYKQIGSEKERKFATEAREKQLEEERARVRKAKPYAYTAKYSLIPPKPNLEHFRSESLARHDKEMQGEREERMGIEKEKAQMRVFKAQPILKECRFPVPENEREPLTEVQESNLRADQRPVDRAEFDKNVFQGGHQTRVSTIVSEQRIERQTRASRMILS
ncbi:hypothetical protein Vadar_013982 [Vaccinium darrowii]|uniref:Uncharacterized protein n=1 Tax=Vaccinium darrowii TaxID=229202 RepID=A0ACB7XRI6_9ERIC|nr:hypothetical protein Vadar_013982 [Vaccinium darrowii]